ncbi:MAG: hypothetical protein ACLPZR_02420 [Solirubrobacteraceae bacterium]
MTRRDLTAGELELGGQVRDHVPLEGVGDGQVDFEARGRRKDRVRQASPW